VTFAAGAASKGLKPFVCIYSTFLQRALDNIIHDIAIQNLPVRFVLDRAGFVGADGATHHGIFDLSYLRMIPNMTIMVPKDGKELAAMIGLLYKHNTGPIAIRFPRGNTDIFYAEKQKPDTLPFGKAELITQGKDICFIAVGTMVKVASEVCQKLKKQNLSCTIINARFVKPLDEKTILKEVLQSKRVVSLEENVAAGGFGAGVAELLQRQEIYKPFKIIGIPDKFLTIGGSQEDQRKLAQIDSESIYKQIKIWLEK
jgi:1-deoxy-D-xylulose-5-phosphate synthase